jgi:Phosphotransferase enzyme family
VRALFIQETIYDPELPQLGELMNTSRIREVMQREMIDRRGKGALYRIDDCQILRAKYRPVRNCLITYRLKITNFKTQEQTSLLITVLACVKGESLSLFNSAQRQSIPTFLDLEVFHLPDLESVVCVFPNDRKLPGLPALVDPGGRTEANLPDIVANAFGDQWVIEESTREVVQYAAESSCTTRVDLKLRNTRTGRWETQVIYGKTYRISQAERAWRVMNHLWDSDRNRSRLFPQPIAYQPEINTIWQTGVVGRPLSDCYREAALFPEYIHMSGSAIAAIHQIQTPFADLITKEEIIARLTRAAEIISRVRPSRRKQLQSILKDLIELSSDIGERPICTLHGDLHMKNLFVTMDGIVLIDFDDLCRGDPLQDVGSFIAALYYRGLIEGRSHHMTEENFRLFIHAYQASIDFDVSDMAINWHIASALIYERASRCVTRLKPVRVEIIDEIIEMAQRLCRSRM